MINFYTFLKKENKGKLTFDDEAKRVFELASKKLHEALPLDLPDFTKDFILQTDASNTIIAGTLLQLNENDNESQFIILVESSTSMK